MDPLFQASHSSHTTTSIKSLHSEGTGVQKETSVKLKENLPVSDDILQDLSLLINDEWLAVGKFLKIPEKNLPKIHTDYGARQKEATYSMLLSWKKEMGKNATYDILVEALKKAGRGDLADLSTELTDSQEQLLVMEELLKRLQILYDLTKRRMAEKTFLPSSESYSIQVKDLTKHGMAEKTSLPSSESHNLTKHGMAGKPFLPPSESYSLQQDLLLAMEENIRFQESLINFHKRELKMEKEVFPSFWQFEDLQTRPTNKILVSLEQNLRCQDRLIDLHKRRLKMANKPFLTSSELHDLQESLILSTELVNCQERFMDLRKLNIEMKKGTFTFQRFDHLQRLLSNMKAEFHRLKGLLELAILESKKENQPSLPSKSCAPYVLALIVVSTLSGLIVYYLPDWVTVLLLVLTVVLYIKLKQVPSSEPAPPENSGEEERHVAKKITLKLPRHFEDKLDHFIRCLKAKYTTGMRSLNSTPWMKSENLNIEDLFVDVDLLLWNPSQSTMSGSSWQSLYSFEDLFTHSELRRAHCITVEGESGSGKTVLLYRMAHSWCINESFTQDVKLFILLPWSCIYKSYLANYSLYIAIKRFLLPKNTFLTVSDLRNILTNTKSILALDDSSPYAVNRILYTNPFRLLGVFDKDIRDLVAVEKLQLICFTSVNTNSLHLKKISNMTVKLQKWHKKQQLSYLQKLLPKDDKTHELILKRLGENSTLVNACENPLFYVLFVHLQKDDLVCEKDVAIKNLWQLLKSTFKNLNKNAITKPVQKEEESEKMSYLYRSTFLQNLEKYTIPKPMEDEKETERISYPQGISKAAYECFRKNEWQIDFPADERDYQKMEDLGILVKDQKDYFNRLSKHYMILAFGMTHRRLARFRFCHKIFHLWFAVLYLSECSNIREEYARLFSPKHSLHWPTPQPSTDKALLQRFICGLNSECSVILLEDLARGRYADNNDEEHFFLSLNEYCGNDDSLQAVVNAICQRKKEFNLGCGKLLVQKSMARLLNLASRWKISIECIDLRNHEIVDVNEKGVILSNGVHLERLSGKEIRINKWYGKQFTNYLKKCLQLVEIRIFANDPRKRRHEIQKEVEGMHFKVRWESNYKHEKRERKTEEEDEIVNLVDLFEKVDIVSEIRSLRSEVLSKEMYVDAKGGRILIEEAAISLDIPPGALKEGVNIRVAVVNAEGVTLPHDDTPMVTPLVKCKPSGLAFEKPVTLVLPHCGILTDSKDHKLICMQGHVSDGNLLWNVDVNSHTTIDQRKFSIELSHFCIRCGSVTDLECKRMRVFILKKKTKQTVLVKLWICNDDQSVFNNIVNEEQDNGYQKIGSHQEFALSKTSGDVQTKCRGIELMIPLRDIWNGNRRSTLFQIPIGTGDIEEILLAKQKEQGESYSLRFFIDDKAPCKRRKRKHSGPTDSTADGQRDCLILVPGNLGSGSSKTINTPQESNELKEFNRSDVVSESSLRNLSGSLILEWKTFGTLLGLTDDDLQITKIDQQGDVKEAIFQMLNRWRKRSGKEATYDRILENLIKVERKDLVDSPKWVNTKTTDSEMEITR